MVKGFIFMNLVPTNVAANKPMLIQKVHGSEGVEKFSGVISNNVAAARSPTTAGLKPEKTSCIIGESMYFINILLIKIIKINDGKIIAIVAVSEPMTAVNSEKPALCIAVYPK